MEEQFDPQSLRIKNPQIKRHQFKKFVEKIEALEKRIEALENGEEETPEEVKEEAPEDTEEIIKTKVEENAEKNILGSTDPE